MNCSADAKTIYAIYSNNYQSSSQEPRRVHSPLPRTTLSTDHCTMELQVFVQFHPFFWPIFIFLDIFNMSIPSGHQKPFPYVPSLVHVPIPVCHLYMIRLWISSANWLWRKQRQDGRLNPPSSVLTSLPAERLRSQCCRRTQRLGRKEQLRCQHWNLQLFWNIYLSTFYTLFSQL